MALQVNWFQDAGAIWVLKDGTFAVDPVKMRAAVVALTRELMHLQARGDRAEAVALLDRLAVLRPPVKRVLDRLEGVPVDIAPRFVTAEQLTRRPATPSAPKAAPVPSPGPKVEPPVR
jgi:hypothetical protein